MMKPALLALTAALVLAAGSFAPTAASAQPYHGGPGYGGWHGGPGYGHPGWGHGPRKICKPVFRTVKVHGPHGWRWKQVAVGERCYFRPRHW